MNDALIEIREYTGPGYQPVIDFQTWRVAILNYLDEIHPAKLGAMERHNETDEVFVLVKGQCILFRGEGRNGIEKIVPQVLEPGKIYNVKKSVWHTVIVSEDGSVLIVENQDTRKENSDYVPLLAEQQRDILATTQREMPGMWR